MLAMFIFIWAVLALFTIWLCKFLYNKYVNNNNNKNLDNITSVGGGLINKTSLDNSGEKRQLSEPREIVASKDIKDLSLKSGSFKTGTGLRNRSSGGGGSGGLGGGGYGTPTASNRKRITRMSPGPELKSGNKSRNVAPPSNVVGPETTSVTWTSQVFRWLYSDLVIVNELLSVWVQALNNSTSKVADDQGVTVEIVRVLPDSPPPSLHNLFCNADESDPSEMIITCDCDAQPVLQIRAVRQKFGKMETHHYKATVSRFRARLSAPMNYNSLKGEMRTEGYPDIRIMLNSVGAVKPMDQDEQQLQNVISEILTCALRDTIYPIDFSIYSTCPRAPEIQPLLDNPVIYSQFNYDSLAMREELMYNLDQYNLQNRMGSPPKYGGGVSSGKRLLVKVLKGEGLIKAKDPYCVVEMDEPPQKNQTGARQGTDPYWDEHFLFDLSPQSAEILFEIYDRPVMSSDSPKFLGLGLVGIDELAVGPASSQILTLQPRPYEQETVTGAIMVEFVFVEGADIPTGPRPYKFKEALKITTPMINEHLKNGTDLADAAVKALQEANGGGNHQPNKSTLIIHSVQRNNRTPFKVELNKDGQIEMNENIDIIGSTDVIDNNKATNQEQNNSISQSSNPSVDIDTKKKTNSSTKSTDDQINVETAIITEINQIDGIGERVEGGSGGGETGKVTSELIANGSIENESFGRSGGGGTLPRTNGLSNDNYVRQGNLNNNSSTAPTGNGLESGTTDDERGRSRKKHDFFGTIKRRFGKSKTRSKSIDHSDMIPIDTENLGHQQNGGSQRSISADRRRNTSSGSGVTAGGGGVLSNNNSPGARIIIPTLDQSRRSSLSESSAISGFSSASTKTYLHEASTLVLETIENGIKRHFLVPLAIAQRPRWRRKGTKLHIYNDHTFVAKHLSGGGLVCAICTKSIPRRPGKQGYECRDCQLICHKQCHIRAPQACPNPTVLSMELSKLNSSSIDKSVLKS